MRFASLNHQLDLNHKCCARSALLALPAPELGRGLRLAGRPGWGRAGVYIRKRICPSLD